MQTIKTYKIDPTKLNEYSKRRIIISTVPILSIALVPLLVAALLFLTNTLTTEDFLFIAFLLPLSGLIIFSLLYYYEKNWINLVAKNFEIVLDENFITRKINLDNEPRLSLFLRFVKEFTKARTPSELFIKISYDNINDILVKKNGDLKIKPINSKTVVTKDTTLKSKTSRLIKIFTTLMELLSLLGLTDFGMESMKTKVITVPKELENFDDFKNEITIRKNK